jgi:hypothetical protein
MQLACNRHREGSGMIIVGSYATFGTGCAGGVIAELFHWWNLRESPQLPAYSKRP